MKNKVSLDLLNLAEKAKNLGEILGRKLKENEVLIIQKAEIENICREIARAAQNYLPNSVDGWSGEDYFEYFFRGKDGKYIIEVRAIPDFNRFEIIINLKLDETNKDNLCTIFCNCDSTPYHTPGTVVIGNTFENPSKVYVHLNDLLQSYSKETEYSGTKFGEFIGQKFQDILLKKKKREQIEKICNVISNTALTFLPNFEDKDVFPTYTFKQWAQYQIEGTEGTYKINVKNEANLITDDFIDLKITFNLNDENLGVNVFCYDSQCVHTRVVDEEIDKLYAYFVDLLSHFDGV